MARPPAALDELRQAIDAALAAYLDQAMPRLTDLHPALEPAAAALRGFVAGGKRLRPALLLLGYAAAGGRDRGGVMGPALALELLHTCALLHDDVIDRAVARRGRPTVHEGFAARHAEAGMVGDPERYGDAAAILLGDLAFVQADELFLQAGDRGVAAGPLVAALRRFTVLREEVTAGQFLDVHAAHTRVTSRQLARTVATLKSGRYSVARPLEIGALLAGTTPRLVAGLGRFGDPLGRAFQVRDDVLGVFGEEAVTGKSAASDLVEGKRTVLVAEAMARLDEADAAELESLLGRDDLDTTQTQRIRALMESSGGRAATEDYVDAQLHEALEALRTLPLAPEPAGALADLARYVATRDE